MASLPNRTFGQRGHLAPTVKEDVSNKELVGPKCVSSVQGTTRHVFFVTAIALDHHGRTLKDRHGELCHRH